MNNMVAAIIGGVVGLAIVLLIFWLIFYHQRNEARADLEELLRDDTLWINPLDIYTGKFE